MTHTPTLADPCALCGADLRLTGTGEHPHCDYILAAGVTADGLDVSGPPCPTCARVGLHAEDCDQNNHGVNLGCGPRCAVCLDAAAWVAVVRRRRARYIRTMRAVEKSIGMRTRWTPVLPSFERRSLMTLAPLQTARDAAEAVYIAARGGAGRAGVTLADCGAHRWRRAAWEVATTPATYFLNPDTDAAEWARAWSAFTDPAALDPETGEVWQYMGSWNTGAGWRHTFRHRCDPTTGQRNNVEVHAAAGWLPPGVSASQANPYRAHEDS